MHETSKVIDPTAQKNIDDWLSGPYSEESKKEIYALQIKDQQQLTDAFYRHLDFGTGGLRGVMGVGTNRMNIYTVRAATQGLADYIKKTCSENPSKVVIGYDSRHNSRLFAEESAKVFIGNGIAVHLFKELRPVPMVSFGVRHLGAQAGVMITASHNPPEYNGYKVYWSDGAQVLAPHDRCIIDSVNAIRSPEQVKIGELSSPLFHMLGTEIDRAYADALQPLALHPELNHERGSALQIVYTSLHGAGSTIIPIFLKQWGFSSVHLVEKQCYPDGSFPTVKSPNPEEKAALELGIQKLQEVKGDILLATDPDTDRLGAVVRTESGEEILNGNELAALMMEYILQQSKQMGRLPVNPHVVKTIVTSELCREIAKQYEATCLDVLTGFKYIGEKINQWEEEQKHTKNAPHYLFGCEESYGYLYGTHARDKDAVICSLLLAEMALFYKEQGKTLYDQLLFIYQTHGVYYPFTKSLTFKGKEGALQMQKLMTQMQSAPPTAIGRVRVRLVEDYEKGIRTYSLTGKKEPLSLPKSNVLLLRLEDGSKLVVRPSGTEPKLKIYAEVINKEFAETPSSVKQHLQICQSNVEELISQFVAILGISS